MKMGCLSSMESKACSQISMLNWDNVPWLGKRARKSLNVWQRQHVFGGIKKRMARRKVNLGDSSSRFPKLCCFRGRGEEYETEFL